MEVKVIRLLRITALLSVMVPLTDTELLKWVPLMQVRGARAASLRVCTATLRGLQLELFIAEVCRILL